MNFYIWGYVAVAVAVLITLAIMRWRVFRYASQHRLKETIDLPPAWAMFVLAALWLPAAILISFAAFRRAFDFDWNR